MKAEWTQRPTYTQFAASHLHTVCILLVWGSFINDVMQRGGAGSGKRFRDNRAFKGSGESRVKYVGKYRYVFMVFSIVL